AHHRVAGARHLPSERIDVRHQAIPQLIYRQHVGFALRAPAGRPAASLRTIKLLVLLAVDAKRGAEGAELEPSGEELLTRRGSEVAADVGGPVRHAGDCEAQAARHFRGELLEGGADVSGPVAGGVPLRARKSASGEDV